MGKGLYTARSLVVRCTVILVGLLFAGFGGSCYVIAAQGADPVTAFVQGMGRLMGLSVGMSLNIFSGACFVIILFVNRKTIGIGTVMMVGLLGTFMDIFIPLIQGALGDGFSFVVAVLLLLVGTVLLAFGLGLYQAGGLGAGPSDALNQTISAKTGLAYKWERMIFDAIMMAGGFLMGGNVHWGTLVGMFGVGPIMAPTMTRFIPLVDRWSGTVPAPAEGAAANAPTAGAQDADPV